MSVSSATAGATIRYTLDGSDPGGPSASTLTGVLTVAEDANIRAVADLAGVTSAIATASYTIVPSQLDQPTIFPHGGAFGEPQTVTISTNEPGATVRMTLDGTTPTWSNGETYIGPFTLREPAMLKVAVMRQGTQDSEVVEARFRIFGQVVRHSGDINLGDGDVYDIVDTLFIHHGDITLTDDAQLIIRDSMLIHDKEFAFETGLTATGRSQVIVENSGIGTTCNGSFNWSFHDRASLIASDMDPELAGCNTWNFMSGESIIQVANWDTFSGTVCDSSNVTVLDSDTLELEFCFPENSVIDTALPADIDHFTFGADASNNVEFSLEVYNSSIDGWGINVLPGSDITIRDTPAVTIGVIVGRPWQEQTVVLDGLARKHYADQRWPIGEDASLHLINTTVYGWEPNVFADNTLVIRNSNYSGSAVNSGDAHYVIEDSTIGQLVANERVRMTVTNAVITGDVIANEDTEILLIDSVVEGTVFGDNERSGGNIFARGNGRVILRNTRIMGHTETRDNGVVIVEDYPQ